MILELVARMGVELRRKSGTHGGEYAGPCPVCGGRDRFLAWPEQGEGGTWYCRGCDHGGDCIELVRHVEGKSFAEACEALGIERERARTRPVTVPVSRRREAFAPKAHDAPVSLWGEHAGKLLAYAHEQLLANANELAGLARRGLPLEAVRRFRLGWLPGERRKDGRLADCYYRARSGWGLPEEKRDDGKAKKLWIPRGLVVPALGADGAVLRLRVRRPEADRERFLSAMKYVVVSGSWMGPLLLLPSEGEARAVVVVEAELDAMACAHAAAVAGLPVAALAVGTNRGKPDAAAHAVCEAALCLLVALDFDQPDERGNRPGAQGYTWWAATYRQAKRWPSVKGKDVGEDVARGVPIAAWIRAGLPPALSGELPKPAPATAAAPVPAAAPPASAGPSSAPGPARLSKPLGRAELLAAPVGPCAALALLGLAGLEVRRCAGPDGPDYRVSGHEVWPLADVASLLCWLRRHGEWVRMALYPELYPDEEA